MQLKNIAVLTVMLFPFAIHAEEKLPSVTVMADHSISVAITKIARSYSQKKNVVVNTSFSAQKSQQEQINEGAAADVLITTKATWIDELKQQGLVDIYSQTMVARNRLVLVGAEDSNVVAENGKLPITRMFSSSDGEPMFLVSHPEFFIDGGYAKEAIRNLGASDDLEPYTLYIKQIDQFFSIIVQQKAFGICFYNSAMGRKGVKIITILPEASYSPIVYYAVVIAGNNMNEARKFMEYLKGREARKIMKDDGLVVE